MTLLAPQHLWLLLGVVALVVAYLLLQRRPPRHAVRHPDVDLVAQASPRSASWRRHLTAALAVVSLIVLTLGLARPAYAVEQPRKQGTVILALDVSLSMAATDVAPTRLTAAVAAAKEFIADSPGDIKIGLVTFDSQARTLVPPTTTRDGLLAALDTLEAGKGTAAGDGLAIATELLRGEAATDAEPSSAAGDEPYQAIVLLADGASTQGQSLDEATTETAESEIPVYTITYGTPNAKLTLNGEVHDASADPAALAAVAEATGGTDYTAQTAGELNQVYDEIGRTVATVREEHELTVPLAAMSAVLLALALSAAAVWSPRLV